MPSVNLRHYRNLVRERLRERTIQANTMRSSKYGAFIAEGKYRSKLGEATGTTAGFRIKPFRLAVKSVRGDGKITLKPWKKGFFLLHPVRTATNIARKMRNRLTRRVELNERKLGIQARGEIRISRRIRSAKNELVIRLNRLYTGLSHHHALLRVAYMMVGAGAMTPHNFELEKQGFLKRLGRFEQEAEKAEREFETKLLRIATDLAAARKKRGL